MKRHGEDMDFRGFWFARKSLDGSGARGSTFLRSVVRAKLLGQDPIPKRIPA